MIKISFLALLIVASMILISCGPSTISTEMVTGTETPTMNPTQIKDSDNEFMATIFKLFPTDIVTRRVIRPPKKPTQPAKTGTPPTTPAPQPAPKP